MRGTLPLNRGHSLPRPRSRLRSDTLSLNSACCSGAIDLRLRTMFESDGREEDRGTLETDETGKILDYRVIELY